MGKLVHDGQVYAEVNKYVPKVHHRLIPRMTSDTTPKGSCSASYVYSGRYAYYGFTTVGNGDLSQASNFWYNNSSGNYIQYNFDEEVTVSKIGFGVIEADNIGKRFKLQFSTDNVNFVDADTFTIASVDWTWYELSSPRYCLAFRIYMIDDIHVVSGIDTLGYEGNIDLRILKGMSDPSVGQGENGQIYLQYVDGDNTFGTPRSNYPTGATISATSQYSTYAPYKAFGDNIDGWGANGTTGTLVFAFDTDTFVPKILSFVDYFDVSGGYLKANSFIFEGSNDGSNWDILYTKTDAADVKDIVKTVNISTQTAYSKFRFVVDGGVGYAGIKNVFLWSEGVGNTIIKTYAKVSGSWQNLIGTDINDIHFF